MKRKKIPITPLMQRLRQLMDARFDEQEGTITERITQFAALCHMSTATMISIMLDGARPRIDTFVKICEGTGTCGEWMLFGSSRVGKDIVHHTDETKLSTLHHGLNLHDQS